MIKKNEDGPRLSLRKSVLIWTVGIFLGWGAAFILVYNLIKTSVSQGNVGEQIMANSESSNPELIEPAAGTAAPDATSEQKK
jgi:hypothetical protein